MNRHRRTTRRALGAAVLLPVVALISVLLPAQPAAAHPLDVYLQAAYLTPAPSTIAVELDISPGVLVAPGALDDLDADRDCQITDAEANAYADRVLEHLHVQADNQTLPLSFTKIDVPAYLTLQAGYGTVRLYAQASKAPTTVGPHKVFFRNDFAPKGAAYQVNAVVNKNQPVVLGTQHRTATQQQSSIDYRIDTTAAPAPAAAAEARPAPAAATGRLASILQSRSLSWGVILLALGLAALLGALHALTPGHAKTLMAAYLVGSGGTTGNALALGAVVTFTHTASVIVIGLIALFASQFLVPGVLVPALEVLSGVLVLVIGLRLVKRRWPRTATRTAVAHIHAHEPGRIPVHAGVSHSHAHSHADHHSHDHEAAADVHSHGGRAHTHTLPAGGITARSLIAMGVSGGLVPCPEALGVMVLAVGVNRTVFGLGLITSFSLGLAAVLMGLGILLVRSRHLVSRFARIGDRWTTVLPLISALIVTALGIGLLLKGIHAGIPLI